MIRGRRRWTDGSEDRAALLRMSTKNKEGFWTALMLCKLTNVNRGGGGGGATLFSPVLMFLVIKSICSLAASMWRVLLSYLVSTGLMQAVTGLWWWWRWGLQALPHAHQRCKITRHWASFHIQEVSKICFCRRWRGCPAPRCP